MLEIWATSFAQHAAFDLGSLSREDRSGFCWFQKTQAPGLLKLGASKITLHDVWVRFTSARL